MRREYREPGPIMMSAAIIALTVLDLIVTVIEDARAWLRRETAAS